ncbi:uncharacterized protein [Miscanthus floridulus]|uniref:uncharacterized protein n=1 Tax=Miscanthus floridulus TaxID=154761 RepID=UPI003457841C
MSDNPAALPSPPARAGMTAWTNGVDDVDEQHGRTWTNVRPRWARWGRCLGLAPGRRGAAGRAAARRRAAGAAWNRWPEADWGGAGRLQSGVWPGWGEGRQGAPALGAAGAPRIRWPTADRGGKGRCHGGARPGRRRAGAGFAGQVGARAAQGGRGRGGAGRVGWARGELAAANGGRRGGVRA